MVGWEGDKCSAGAKGFMTVRYGIKFNQYHGFVCLKQLPDFDEKVYLSIVRVN
jgi:hypothetical protein